MNLITLQHPPVWETEITEYPLFARGKVRDIYDLGDQLLIVATDRISAFDVILDDPIPGKGEVLNRLSEFWFGYLGEMVPHHLVTTKLAEYPEELQRYGPMLEGRSMLVNKYRRIDVECVARGYIAGSLWKEYRQKSEGTSAETIQLLGFEFPPDLQLAERLPEIIFTPATKAEHGHDENISYAQLVAKVGAELAEKMRQLTIEIYLICAGHAEKHGIILADTKFEFGLDGEKLILIDEVCSPDSSRFWPSDEYEVGRAQRSFDKQGVRDFLEGTGWDKSPPPPPLPAEIIATTTQRYQEVWQRLTQPTQTLNLKEE